jgi:glycosyltransferase involved in cell wall biosynthesis
MRLLIDSVTVGSGGLLQLRDELSKAAAAQAPRGSRVLLLTTSESVGLRDVANLEILSLKKPRWGWVGRWWWYSRTLPRLARRNNADVIYSLSGILTARTARDSAIVTSVNNMLPFSNGDATVARARLRYFLLRRAYVYGLRRADAVVLHSRSALELAIPHAGDISRKTFVALTGVPSDISRDRTAREEHPLDGRPYLLNFSTFYPYKNHIRLIDAYIKALSVEPDLPDLIFAGMPGDRLWLDHVMGVVAQHRLESRIRYVGALGRSDVARWIYHAVINFFPSTCETNPVTVAEILGLGAVLACSTSPPMPEIVGDAAEYFDPRSVDSISEAIVRVVRDPNRRNTLREQGIKRAAQLSWDECAVQIWRAAEVARTSYEERNSRAQRQPS